jgi:hypothetical protein
MIPKADAVFEVSRGREPKAKQGTRDYLHQLMIHMAETVQTKEIKGLKYR